VRNVTETPIEINLPLPPLTPEPATSAASGIRCIKGLRKAHTITCPGAGPKLGGTWTYELTCNGSVDATYADARLCPRCVFWDTTLKAYSSEGCWVQLQSKGRKADAFDPMQGRFKCACSHLSDFAVAMVSHRSSFVLLLAYTYQRLSLTSDSVASWTDHGGLCERHPFQAR
jgi:hypothetical protein